MTFKLVLLSNFLIVFASCMGQSHNSAETQNEQGVAVTLGDTVLQIGKNIRCVFQDDKNNFWFASDGEGVFRYDGKTILQLTDKHGLCSKFVWSIQQSDEGVLLYNTRDGVCSFDGKQFRAEQPDENFFESTDFSNAVLLSGNYYRNRSIHKFHLPETSRLTKTYSSAPYAIYCSFRDSKGNIWFGTESRGACKFDGKAFTWLEDKELGAPIRSIFEDKNGNIWMGNNGYGLFRYDGKTLTNFTKEHNLENPGFLKGLKGKEGTLARVWTITDDKQGNIWIGTIDAGLWKYDGKVLTNYTTINGLASNSISTVYCDTFGNLWIGTGESGITIYDGKTFKIFAGQE